MAPAREAAREEGDKGPSPRLRGLLFLFVIALGVGGYILSNQRFNPPAWVPLVGEEFYELEAELSTAQAVVPGQGQTVNIAGVKVGDIGEVRLEDGRAVVEMLMDESHAPVYRDATILLRPKTGLKDMFLELDPGTKAAGRVPGGRAHLGLQHASRREPRRGAGAARRRHPGLPARAPELGRRGAGGRGLRRPARDLQALRAHRARLRAHHAAAREAPRQRQAGDPQLPGAVDRAGHQGSPAGRARDLGQCQLRGHLQPGRGAAPGAAPPARHARADPHDARQPAGPDQPAGPGAVQAAAGCARARAVAAPDAGPSCAPPRRRSAIRSARSRAMCSPPFETCAAPRTTSPR